MTFIISTMPALVVPPSPPFILCVRFLSTAALTQLRSFDSASGRTLALLIYSF